jgi:hypothetical protein
MAWHPWRIRHMGLKIAALAIAVLLWSFIQDQQLVIEPSAAKSVRVLPAVEGLPAAGFRVGAITVEPAEVQVAGPASALARLTGVATEPISVAGATGPVRGRVNVRALDPAILLRSPQRVDVLVDVSALPASAGRE